MKSRLNLRGHPLHPMLVSAPIGLYVWTLVADIVYLVTQPDPTWYDIAFWSGIAGVVTALAAAIPGFVDYLGLALRRRHARATATAHMLLNVFTTVLYLVAALLMRDAGASAGVTLAAVVVLHAAGATALASAGWLGGELIYRHGFGVFGERMESDGNGGRAPQQE